jgi:hypothetical protein
MSHCDTTLRERGGLYLSGASAIRVISDATRQLGLAPIGRSHQSQSAPFPLNRVG